MAPVEAAVKIFDRRFYRRSKQTSIFSRLNRHFSRQLEVRPLFLPANKGF